MLDILIFLQNVWSDIGSIGSKFHDTSGVAPSPFVITHVTDVDPVFDGKDGANSAANSHPPSTYLLCVYEPPEGASARKGKTSTIAMVVSAGVVTPI